MEPKPRKKHTFLRIIAALVVISAALLADSAYRLVTDEYEICGAPEDLDGFRIVQLSDLHRAGFGEGNSRLLARVEGAGPDIIALTGDFLNEAASSKGEGAAESLRPLFEALCGIAPTYFVSGNHDWASHEYHALAAVLEESGVVCLDNDWARIREGLCLVGVCDPNGPADMKKPDEVVAAARAEYPEDYFVLLAHRNDWPEKYPVLPLDLILCGHGHGGIVRLPFIGGLLGTSGELLPEYDAGLFDCGAYQMLVSRGLGNSISVPRVFNNPQIAVAVLRTA